MSFRFWRFLSSGSDSEVLPSRNVYAPTFLFYPWYVILLPFTQKTFIQDWTGHWELWDLQGLCLHHLQVRDWMPLHSLHIYDFMSPTGAVRAPWVSERRIVGIMSWVLRLAEDCHAAPWREQQDASWVQRCANTAAGLITSFTLRCVHAGVRTFTGTHTVTEMYLVGQ